MTYKRIDNEVKNTVYGRAHRSPRMGGETPKCNLPTCARVGAVTLEHYRRGNALGWTCAAHLGSGTALTRVATLAGRARVAATGHVANKLSARDSCEPSL